MFKNLFKFAGVFVAFLFGTFANAQNNISLDREVFAGISLQKKLTYQLLSKDYDYSPKDCNSFLMKSPSQKIVLDKLCKLSYKGKDLQGFNLALNSDVYVGLLEDKVVSISTSSRLDNFTATKEGIDFIINDLSFRWGLKPILEKENTYSFTVTTHPTLTKKNKKVKNTDTKNLRKVTAYVSFKPELKMLEIDFAVEPIIEITKQN